MLKVNKFHLSIALVSLILWVTSLFCSIYTLKVVTVDETTITDNPGYWVYIWNLIWAPVDFLFSLGGDIQGSLVVLTNPMYFYCLFMYLTNKHRWVRLILICISVLALCGFYYFKDFWVWGDTVYKRTIVSKDIGYYLWLSSYVVLFIGVIINTDRNILKNDINNLVIRIRSAYVQYKSNLARSIVLTILVVSVILFVLSLFYPMYQYQWLYDDGDYSAISNLDGLTFYYANIMKLPINLCYSLVGRIRGDIIVVTLPIYFLCVVLLVINKNRWLQLALMSISVFSLYLFYFVADLPVDNVDAQKYTIISKGAAYYLWQSSYIVLLIDIITNILIIRYNQKGGSKCIK